MCGIKIHDNNNTSKRRHGKIMFIVFWKIFKVKMKRNFNNSKMGLEMSRVIINKK